MSKVDVEIRTPVPRTWVEFVDPADAGVRLERARVEVHAEPLLMTDVAAASRIAGAALELAARLSGPRSAG